ncbi:hypothetical protein G3N58_17785 [Paraburkholderia sp. Ac-20342]|uniref:hypothetical protein n=1 Tax=Paraburkholderia sp. Ac-20342 TaxID=2703889 RepID=UPI001981F37E|nr:hypothetical protein [Paraburkholderia sp. Ac-20342]MBN3848660.1 hypothetical protein [Paraburkholderia sp. Ac-20342]
MTADKRSVATDALETLGTIIDDRQARDAIHLAVEPVVAAHAMCAGADVGLMPDGRASELADKKLGIVDPFLKDGVVAGERFWLVVYPRQITSLRHVWEHPDFAISPDVTLAPKYSESEQWIRNFADGVSLHYDVLMEGAAEWVRTNDGKWGGEYLCFGGLLEGCSVPDEFWNHYDAVTGNTTPEEKRGSFFTCSC